MDHELLARAMARRLEGRGTGAVALVDFLGAPDAEKVCVAVRGLLPGWDAVVVDGGPPVGTREDQVVAREDQVVALREDVDRRLLVFLPLDVLASGLQGVRSTAEVIPQASIYKVATKMLLEDMDRTDPNRTECCRALLKRHQQKTARSLSAGAQARAAHAFAMAARQRGAGPALHHLGWLPDGGQDAAVLGRIGSNLDAVGKLLPRHLQSVSSLVERVRSLRLSDAGFHDRLMSFLEGLGRQLDDIETWGPRLLQEGLGFERWAFEAEEVQQIDLVPFRTRKGKAASWSHLKTAAGDGEEPGRLELRVPLEDDKRLAKACLEVRWKVEPPGIRQGEVIYEVLLRPVAGTEPLYERRVEHSASKNYERHRVPVIDILDVWNREPVEVEVCVLADPDGNRKPEATVADGNTFFLVPDTAEAEEQASGRAEPVKGYGEAILWARTKGADGVTSRFFRTEKRGVPVRGVRFRRFQAILRRPRVLALAESQLVSARTGGHLPYGTIELDRAGRALDPKTTDEPVPPELEAFLATRARLLRNLTAEEAHPPLAPLTDQKALARLDEYLRVWRRGLQAGLPPAAWRVDTYVVRDNGERELAVLLSPFHPVRLLWAVGYELICHRILEEGPLPRWKELRRVLDLLDGRSFPPLLPSQAVPGSSGPWVCAEVLEGAWAIFLASDDRHPGESLDRVRRALDLHEHGNAEAAVRDWLVERVRCFLDMGLGRRQLRVLSHACGDGALIDEVIAEAIDGRERPPPPRVRVTLVRGEDLDADTWFDRAARGGEGVSSRLLDRESAERTTVFRPALEWRITPAAEPVDDAHLALLGDLFRTEVGVQEDLGQPGDAMVYGLVLPTSVAWRYGTGGWIRWWRPWHGQRQERLDPYTRRMKDLLDAWLRAVLATLRTGPEVDGDAWWPAVMVDVHGPPRRLLEELHQHADWIFVLDRRVTRRLWDVASDAEASLGTLIEVHGAPGTDLGGAMVVSRVHAPLLLRRIERRLEEWSVERPEDTARLVVRTLPRLGGPLQVRAMANRDGVDRAILAAAGTAHPEFRDGLLVSGDALGVRCCDLVHVALREGTLSLRPVLLGDVEPEADPGGGLRKACGLDAADGGGTLRRLRVLPLVRALLAACEHSGRANPRLRRAIGSLLAAGEDDASREVEVAWPWALVWRDGEGAPEVMDGTLRVLRVGPCDLERLGEGTRDLSREGDGEVMPPDAERVEGGGVREATGVAAGSATPPGSAGAGEELQALAVSGDDGGGHPPPAAGPRTMDARVGPSVPGLDRPLEADGGGPAGGGPAEVRLRLGEEPSGRVVKHVVTTAASPHVLVVGRTGTGKTTLLVHLVRQVHEAGCGALVIGFHEDLREQIWAALARSPPAVVSARQDGVPLDPLSFEHDPASGERALKLGVADHAQAVAETWATIFEGLGEVQRGLLEQAAKGLYHQGIDGGTPGRADFTAFPRALQAVVKRSASRGASGQNLLARVERFGDVFTRGEALGLERLRLRCTVLDASGFESEERMRGIACFVLEHVYRRMKTLGSSRAMRLVVFLDEAHLAAKLQTLDRLAREGRKYGIGLCLASQSASDFSEHVYKNTGLQVVLGVDGREAEAITSHWTRERQQLRRYRERIRSLESHRAVCYDQHGRFLPRIVLPAPNW